MLTYCPVCDGRVITLFDKINLRPRGAASIYICRTCLALLNGAAYDALEKGQISELQKTDFYAVTADEHAVNHLDKVATYQQILQVFFQHEARSLADLTFLDFGSAADMRHWPRRPTVDAPWRATTTWRHSRPLSRHWKSKMPSPAMSQRSMISPRQLSASTLYSCGMCSSICLIRPVSGETAGSTFNPEPRSSCSRRCSVPRNVIDAHFVFFTEPSLRRWSEEIGAEPIDFRYDVPLAFIALHARMNGRAEDR